MICDNEYLVNRKDDRGFLRQSLIKSAGRFNPDEEKNAEEYYDRCTYSHRVKEVQLKFSGWHRIVPIETKTITWFFPCFAEIEPSKDEFNTLASEWRRDTGKLSMLHRIVLHPSYQRIIGMGHKALPWIFEEMQARGGHWLWALENITGLKNVAKPEHNFKQAFQAWMEWGHQNGYI